MKKEIQVAIISHYYQLMEVKMEHDVDRISAYPNDYKYCCKCGRINYFENNYCITCKGTIFRRLNNDDAWELRDEWENKLSYRMEV